MMYTLSWNLRPAFVSKKTGLLATLRAGRPDLLFFRQAVAPFVKPLVSFLA